MARFFRWLVSWFTPVGNSLLLGFFWCFGQLLAYYFYCRAGASFSSLMQGMTFHSVSIVSLLLVCVLPFLISAYFVYIGKPDFLLAICLVKGFLFSLISIGITDALGASGPLLRCVFLFHDLLSAPILFWYWNKHISGKHPFQWTETVFLLSCFILIGSIEFCFISPFGAELIKS